MAVSTNDSLRERRRCHRGITSLVLRGNAYGRRSEETVGRGTPMNEERRQHLLESRFTRPLSGTGAVGEVERESAPVGTYHETRQLAAAFPVSGSGASHGAQPPGMAGEVCAAGDRKSVG